MSVRVVERWHIGADGQVDRHEIDVAEQAGRACVLLSGGLDSTAALLWALANRVDVRAVAFDYGQPHRDAELAQAQRLCERRGVPFTRLALADTLTTRVGLMIGVHDHGVGGSAILNAAFVPARNAVFLSVAAAHALSWWPDGRVDLVLGACVEDATGFPDCTAQFLAAMTRTLVAGTTREVVIVAPFLDRTKEAMLRDFASDPDAVRDLSESWSCYRGRGPCGTCSACVFRHRAFEAAGFTDCARVLPMIGGDPSRERCS